MFAKVRLFLLLLLALADPAFAQQAGRRVALVIANGQYANAQRLENPPNDGRLIADSLRKAGFSSVDLRTDQGLAAFQQALREFRTKADGADVALVYYAGHGIEGQGKNWLIPTDAKLATDRDLAFEAIDLDLVMQTIGGAKLRVAILDACRNNPFGQSWRAGTRAVTRGLTGVEVDDVLVIFAAAPGQTAADGDDANSPFAASLARHLPEPGLAIQLLGGVVRDDVLAATDGAQRPFISASITGTAFYLVPTGAAAPQALLKPAPEARGAPAGTTPPPATATPSAASADTLVWTARQPDLAMASVEVRRHREDDGYAFQVSGTYPSTRLNGKPMPVASYIRVVARDLSAGSETAIAGTRQEMTGSWAPGTSFTTEFRMAAALVDGAQALSIRLCMGAEKNCLFSPDLARPPGPAAQSAEPLRPTLPLRRTMRRARKP